MSLEVLEQIELRDNEHIDVLSIGGMIVLHDTNWIGDGGCSSNLMQVMNAEGRPMTEKEYWKAQNK